MYADSMAKKNLYRKILNDFRRGKIGPVVGTQMIAKGLDFPNVTLVGLVTRIGRCTSRTSPRGRAHLPNIIQVSGGRARRPAGRWWSRPRRRHAPPIQGSPGIPISTDFSSRTMEQRRLVQLPALPPPDPPPVPRTVSRRGSTFIWSQWLKVLEPALGERIEVRGAGARADREDPRRNTVSSSGTSAPSASRVIRAHRAPAEGFQRMDRENNLPNPRRSDADELSRS